jgi:hypothetical protein
MDVHWILQSVVSVILLFVLSVAVALYCTGYYTTLNYQKRDGKSKLKKRQIVLRTASPHEEQYLQLWCDRFRFKYSPFKGIYPAAETQDFKCEK